MKWEDMERMEGGRAGRICGRGGELGWWTEGAEEDMTLATKPTRIVLFTLNSRMSEKRLACWQSHLSPLTWLIPKPRAQKGGGGSLPGC